MCASTPNAPFGCWTTCTCHIAQTRRTGDGRKTNAPSHTSRRSKAFLKEREIQLLTWAPCSRDLSPLDLHFWQEWETALGNRQLTSQLELRAVIVRTVSALDPEEHWVHSQMLGVRARQRRPFQASLVMDQLTCTRLFVVSFDPS